MIPGVTPDPLFVFLQSHSPVLIGFALLFLMARGLTLIVKEFGREGEELAAGEYARNEGTLFDATKPEAWQRGWCARDVILERGNRYNKMVASGGMQ